MSWLSLDALLRQPDPTRMVAAVEAADAAGNLDHAELCHRAAAFGDWLQTQGLRRIALYLPDAGDLAVGLLGAWGRGVSVTLPGDDRDQTRSRLASRIDRWLDELPPASVAPTTAQSGPQLDLDRPLLTLATSGSSGLPKYIDKTLRQLANEVAVLEECWGSRLGDVTVAGTVSAQHIYGLLFRVLWPLCAGRPFLRRVQLYPEELQRVSLAQPSTVWVTSPALLKRMSENLDWAALAPRVTALFSSGGELPAAAGETLKQRLGQYPIEIYGSSETGGIGWRRGGDRWRPFPGVTLSIGSDGALAVASAYLPVGATEQTADAATLADDGTFRLCGRLDRIVKLEEKRVSLPLLEAALCQHPWIRDARLALIQEQRAFLGAVVALSAAGLHALRNGGRRALTDTLRQQLAPHCERLALPRRWRLLQELPCNAQGKLQQVEIDALLAAPRPIEPALRERTGDGDEWQLLLEVPVDLAHFSGHFPQTPVVPGVVQIDWVQRLSRRIMELPVPFIGMEVLKFQQLVRPGDTLTLTLRFDRDRNKLHFAFRRGDANCSSGRILLGAA